MAIGRTEDRVNPWDPMAQFQATVRVWVPIRGFHLGQQLNQLHQQAGHMTASDQIARTAAQTPCRQGAVHIWVPGQYLGVPAYENSRFLTRVDGERIYDEALDTRTPWGRPWPFFERDEYFYVQDSFGLN